MTNQTPIDPQLTDTRKLRQFLVEKMQDAATGRLQSERAKSVCNLAQQVYNTLNIELKMATAKSKLNGQTIDAVSFID